MSQKDSQNPLPKGVPEHFSSVNSMVLLQIVNNTLFSTANMFFDNQLDAISIANAQAHGRDYEDNNQYFIREDQRTWIPSTYVGSVYTLPLHEQLTEEFQTLSKRIAALEYDRQFINGFLKNYFCFVFQSQALRSDLGNALFNPLRKALFPVHWEADKLRNKQFLYEDFMQNKQPVLQAIRQRLVRNTIEIGSFK